MHYRALAFLGAALFVSRDFMERIDVVWAPLVRGAGIDARTTQSPLLAERFSSRVLAVIRNNVFDLARSNTHDLDDVTDHIGRALLAFWASRHDA
jgi:hypothetical protein